MSAVPAAGTSPAGGCCGAWAGTSAGVPRCEPSAQPASRPLDRAGMVVIPAGPFLMGSDRGESFVDDGEGPVRDVHLPRFLIDATAVSNRAFAEFVRDTGHVTDAEREGWSYVFHALLPARARGATHRGVAADAPWWLAVSGAHWRCPEGPGSDVIARAEHPVVHVSWHDAVAYAAWCGKRLPTEAQWERGARGTQEQAAYPGGDERRPAGRHRCNLWQGRFPEINTGDDGHIGTCPVNAFEPNGLGLYNCSGNVWEWCADWWSADWHANDSAATRHDPRGPLQGSAKLIRGGSYLCHASYCNRYRVAARHYNDPNTSTGHMGFRCAADLA